ncbi:ABC transporter permease [Corynebacterium sp. zg254]|uniref:ABC transporter permease n=1 Tax=Corynebacterium zhongnanshanii TaxID=2768834 RepID=A0ABQ6VEV2_9CORY|nr:MULTISPECIES: ABC transporter permease [Corynebacterium]KAB3522962.1 ABC transporter permease [Corynebacterium zhongnanshanii]MCR5913955.1 ABC transporter permease [Corynebacterium sp. zg254]
MRAELKKLTSLRSTWVYVVLLTGSLYGPAVLMSFLNSDPEATFGWGDTTLGGMIFLLVLLIFAASSTAGDINDRMVAHSFLTQRRRSQWLLAKAALIVIVAEVSYWIGIAISAVVLHFSLEGKWTGGDMYDLWIYALFLPVYALMAVGLAGLTRSKIMGSGIPMVLFLVIEPLLAAAAQHLEWVKYIYYAMPGTRLSDLTQWHALEAQGDDVLDAVGLMTTPAQSAIVILAWGALLFGVAILANNRRDTR